MESGPEDHEQSEFNSSIEALRRICKLKELLISEFVHENYLQICKLLKPYWLELECLLTTTDLEKYAPEYYDFLETYATLRSQTSNKNLIVQKSIIINIENFYSLLNKLTQQYNMNILKRTDPRFSLKKRR